MPPTRPPTPTDFPSNLTLTLTHPPPTSTTPSANANANARHPTNILILLHGLGDTLPALTSLAQALHLPETTILTLQAPTHLPLDLPGYHWGDDISFDSSSGALDMDAGFARSKRLINDTIIRDTLIAKCGYAPREISLFGIGQGGMLALLAARELELDVHTPSSTTTGGGTSGSGSRKGSGSTCLGGIISIGAPFPLSSAGQKQGGKNRTPVLLVAGRDSPVVTDGAVRRTQAEFEFVEVHRYARRGDGMPRCRDEMVPVMRFFARILRSWAGVPGGSVEIS
ncbi:Alpha/Beta hydrolase protein [Aspergillus taichungensis]|uniref:Alpha/Beta hydrolase protein n=1 Tax=Aspergillus taichungensis TaxID=482145 RepID=A0A2J5HW40_9EURO|nr:Alpha/Beta hydrolase protein [Aspergillus taichungensis]